MKYISPNDLFKHWTYVREGLDRIQAKTPENYLPEDVYAGIKAGSLHLYVDDGKCFAILQSIQGWKGLEVHVFAAYSLDPKVMDYAFDEVKEIARKAGASKLTFCTRRKGWERRAKQLGYKKSQTHYELEL